MIDIVSWADLAGSFPDTLILGNGASIAIDSCFQYSSLLEQAEDASLITAEVRSIFDYLETQDFELVMRMIRHAYHVNQALRVDEASTTKAYQDIRTALVVSVRNVHPVYESVTRYLPAMHEFMRRFDTVLSLNYDLLVYWAMMEGNRTNGTWFKDCFVKGIFDDDWTRFRDPMAKPQVPLWSFTRTAISPSHLTLAARNPK
jgi:hypothetical protein